jgi:uncharacterized membrane protein HdeD (DUF308 family)
MLPPDGKVTDTKSRRVVVPERPRRAFLRWSPAVPATALILVYRPSLALRSVAAIVFAIAFFWPTLEAGALAPLFAGYAFVDGALALSPGGWRLPYRRAWPLMIGGGIDIVAAAWAYVLPEMTLPLLISVTMAWAIATGVSFAVASISLREADDEYLLLLCGIGAFVFSRALLSHLASDAIVFSTWMGLYVLTFGVVLLKLTLKYYQVLWEGPL